MKHNSNYTNNKRDKCVKIAPWLLMPIRRIMSWTHIPKLCSIWCSSPLPHPDWPCGLPCQLSGVTPSPARMTAETPAQAFLVLPLTTNQLAYQGKILNWVFYFMSSLIWSEEYLIMVHVPTGEGTTDSNQESIWKRDFTEAIIIKKKLSPIL